MDKFNLDKLVRVRVNDFYPSCWFVYLTFKPKKYFWQTEIKEGVYREFIDAEYVGDTPKNHTLKDGIVYENPEVIMFFQGGVETKKYFDTLEEAKTFATEITKGKNWLLK